VSPEIAARLQTLEIQMAAQAKEYGMFVRGTCVALVRFGEPGCASIGSSGIMTENGLAYLVWRDGQPILATHGGREQPATPGELETVRRFSEDLKSALGLAQ
jgi:hypothetical protein